MIKEIYNSKTNEFECFDPDLDFLAFKGLGKTKAEAKINYFSRTIIKDPRETIKFEPVA